MGSRFLFFSDSSYRDTHLHKSEKREIPYFCEQNPGELLETLVCLGKEGWQVLDCPAASSLLLLIMPLLDPFGDSSKTPDFLQWILAAVRELWLSGGDFPVTDKLL